MRITHTMLTSSAARNLSGVQERLGKLQGQITSGEVASRASEDPYRAVAAMEWQALQRRIDRAEAAAGEARDWLAAAEDGLNRLLNALQHARELSVSARSVPTADAREAMAQEVDRMREEALAAANTQYRAAYLFAGYQVNTVPFAADGSGGADYNGDGGNPQVEVLPGVRMTTRVTGDRLRAGGDFVRVLSDLAAAIRAGDSGAIAQYQGDLDRTLDTVTAERSDVGVRMRTLDEYAAVARDTRVQIEEQLASAVGTDLARVAMQLAQEEVTYRAALAAASRTLPGSLLEMMR